MNAAIYLNCCVNCSFSKSRGFKRVGRCFVPVLMNRAVAYLQRAILHHSLFSPSQFDGEFPAAANKRENLFSLRAWNSPQVYTHTEWALFGVCGICIFTVLCGATRENSPRTKPITRPSQNQKSPPSVPPIVTQRPAVIEFRVVVIIFDTACKPRRDGEVGLETKDALTVLPRTPAFNHDPISCKPSCLSFHYWILSPESTSPALFFSTQHTALDQCCGKDALVQLLPRRRRLLFC